jgi:hypothetical protein
MTRGALVFGVLLAAVTTGCGGSAATENYVARASASQHPINGKGHPFARWHLATGTPEDVKRPAGFFGLDYIPEARLIAHSLRTAIVDPTGRVYKVFEGNEWQVGEVVSALRELAAATKDAGKT